MKLSIFSLCILAASLCAEESVPDSASLSSSNAAYDGNTLVLTGHVMLDHGLGKMAADTAKLEKQETGKDFPFSLIHLQNNVHVSLKSEAQVQCDSADFDFSTLKGLLLSQGESRVVYSDTLKKKKGEKAHFRLLGKTVELGMSKKAEEGKKSDFEIETILAKEDVLIDYAEEFTLRAGHALYRKGSTPEKPGSYKEFQGTITAYPQDSEHPCLLTHQGDLIQAQTVDLDLIHSKISLLNPRGSLLSSILPGLQKGEMRFACKHLVWDHMKNILTLKGDVAIAENLLGDLTSDGTLEIVQEKQKQERLLKTIRANGKTTLHFKDSGDNAHHLVSHGSFLFDRQHYSAFMESPKKDGVVPTDRQIYYEAQNFGLYADRAHMEYAEKTGNAHPSNVQLFGAVRLFSLDSVKPRYAIADRLSFSTTTRTLILSANPGKNVLFFDEKEAVRISAPEVHITQDHVTHKESVQGIGRVQFAFTDEENSLLKRVFPHYTTQANHE